ncbi:MAG: hypothetical protein QXS19_05790 [Candidatus Methanomethylicia archaeon]
MKLFKIKPPYIPPISAITLDHIQMLPIHPSHPISEDKYVYDLVTIDNKTYLMLKTLVMGYYPSVSIRQSIIQKEHLDVNAIVRTQDDWSSTFIFFLEPHKGDYSNFVGFETDATNLYCKTTRNGSSSSATIKPINQLPQEMYLRIRHRYARDYVRFFLNDELVCQFTENIPDQPLEINAIEPKGGIKTRYLRTPPGIFLGYPYRRWW